MTRKPEKNVILGLLYFKDNHNQGDDQAIQIQLSIIERLSIDKFLTKALSPLFREISAGPWAIAQSAPPPKTATDNDVTNSL